MKINKKFINEVGRAFGCGLTVYTKDSCVRDTVHNMAVSEIIESLRLVA